MISFIVPPLIIILGIGAIIVLLARRTRDVDFTVVPQKKKSVKQSHMPHTRSTVRSPSKKGISEKFSTSLQSLKRSSESLFKKNKKDAAMMANLSDESIDATGTQDEIEKSTLTFVRRRLMLQEQQKQSTMQGGDVENPHEGKKYYNEQEVDLVRRIADHPHDIDAYEQLGDYYLVHKNYDEAHQCFKQILKMQPRNRRAQMIMKRFAQDHEKTKKNIDGNIVARERRVKEGNEE